jgi:P-type conjugative transfer protein TrbJ
MRKFVQKRFRNKLTAIIAIIITIIIATIAIRDVGVGCGVRRAEAGGGGFCGATEFTQLDNKLYLGKQVSRLNESLSHEIEQIANQVKRISNQITMIKDMIYNTTELPFTLSAQVAGSVSRIIAAYNRVDGLLARLANLDDEFYSRFYSATDSVARGSNYGWTRNYAQEYYNLSLAMEKKAKDISSSLNVTAEDIHDSSRLLEDLSQSAASAEGRNAILQAGNDLAGFMSGELIKIRALQAEQTKTYLDYAERRRTREDAAADVVKKDLEKWKVPAYTPKKWTW